MLCQMKQWMKIKIRGENSLSSITHAQYRVDFGSDGMFSVKSVEVSFFFFLFFHSLLLFLDTTIYHQQLNTNHCLPFDHLSQN